jgi:hypothetical protein
LNKARTWIKDKNALIQSHEHSMQMQEAQSSPIQRLVNILNWEIAPIFNGSFTRRTSEQRGGKTPISYIFTHNDLDTIYIEIPPMRGRRFYQYEETPNRSSLKEEDVISILIARTYHILTPVDISRVLDESTRIVVAILPSGVEKLLSA